MADRGGQQLEAFSGKKKKSKTRSQRTPYLAWMYGQCSDESPESRLFSHFSGDASRVPPLDIQSYHYWKSVFELERVAHPVRYRRRTILIQPLTHSLASSGYKHTKIHPSVLSHLCAFCEQFFHGMTVEVTQPVDLSQITKLSRRIHQSTNREQFLVGDIRKFLKSRRPNRAFCTLGVTVADLYPSPEWNFVLGEASMGEGCGVFSFGRYFNSVTAPATETATAAVEIEEREREQLRNLWVLIRVMSHELCHIFGLKHCYYFDCAMNESESIAEAATQPLFLCPVCLRKMQKAVRFNPLQRYRGMLEVTKQIHSAVLAAGLGGEGDERDARSETGSKSGALDSAVHLEAGSNVERNAETSEDQNDPSNHTDHDICDTGSNGESNGRELVDKHYGASSHNERFEDAIGWLENVVSSLAQFEDQWVK